MKCFRDCGTIISIICKAITVTIRGSSFCLGRGNIRTTIIVLIFVIIFTKVWAFVNMILYTIKVFIIPRDKIRWTSINCSLIIFLKFIKEQLMDVAEKLAIGEDTNSIKN